jgi:hypothetical protein
MIRLVLYLGCDFFSPVRNQGRDFVANRLILARLAGARARCLVKVPSSLPQAADSASLKDNPAPPPPHHPHHPSQRSDGCSPPRPPLHKPQVTCPFHPPRSSKW